VSVWTAVSVGLVLVLAAWAGAALAKTPPPKAKELSAISQYREPIPGASGPTLPGGRSTTKPLPQSVQVAVLSEGGSDAPALKRFAEESEFGAPPTSLPSIRPRQRVTEPDQGAPAALFSGAGKLVVDGQSGRVVALVVVMAVLTAGAVGLAVRRRAV
jgi:hypothetical protein